MSPTVGRAGLRWLRWTRWLALGAGGFAFVPLAAVPWPAGDWPDRVRVRLGAATCEVGPELVAEVAQTAEARATGLSRRPGPLPPQEAMLFVFEAPGPRSFWMKDTWIPLGLMYFAPGGWLTSRHYLRVEPDPSDPRADYVETSSVSAALELSPAQLARSAPVATRLCVDVGDGRVSD
jgi:uncharacterized membrane protein (UPF0127 family)